MSLQGNKKFVKQDIGDQLMSLLETNRILEEEQILKHEVAQLQSKAEKLEKRRENLKNDLIRNVNTNNNDSGGPLHLIKVRPQFINDSTTWSNNEIYVSPILVFSWIFSYSFKFPQLNYLRDKKQLESQSTQDQNASELLDAFRRSQETQAWAICHGVTTKTGITHTGVALEEFEGHARLTSYQFHPVSEKSGKVIMINII